MRWSYYDACVERARQAGKSWMIQSQGLSADEKRIIEEVGNLLEYSPDRWEKISRAVEARHELGHARRRVKQNQANEVKRKNQEKRDQEFYPKLQRWLVANLRPGLLLKMQGCRDGDGYREVIDYDLKKNTVTCYKLILPFVWKGVKQELNRDQITTHGLEKVLGTIKLTSAEDVHRGAPQIKYTSFRKTL